MSGEESRQTMLRVRQELASIQRRANSVCVQSQSLVRQTESAKVESLQKHLERKIEEEARRRGMASIRRDKRRLPIGVSAAAISFVAGGLLFRDGLAAVNSGLAGFERALQGFGRARWVVLLGRRIVVAASDSIPIQGQWLAWESLKLALEELRSRALGGEVLGNLDDVLSRLEQKRERRLIPFKLAPGQLESKE